MITFYSNKKTLLNNQLKENSLLREEINNLQKELRVRCPTMYQVQEFT